MGRRVLRFDSHFVAEGCGIALRAMSFIIPLRGMENRTTAPSARGNAPLLPTAPLHRKASHAIFRSLCSLTNHVRLPPRRGRFALRSALGIISTSMHSTAKSSPSGGKVVPKVPKGVHFLRAIGAVVWFFLCYCPICKLPPPPSTKGDPLPQAAYILIARQGDTTTLSGAAAVKPKNPRGESPVHLKNLFLSYFREYHSAAGG